MNEVTLILQTIQQGNPGGASELIPVVYNELRKLAAYKMASERQGHTLQPTALVHEAYLRLVGSEQPQAWTGRTHFFAAAAEAMRRILVDSARRRKASKHGGHFQRVDSDADSFSLPLPADELVELDEALERLATVDSRAADTVKLCFFVGLTHEEAAKELGASLATVERLWAFARTWLFREIQRRRQS